jgi:signal transduction histidine kinase
MRLPRTLIHLSLIFFLVPSLCRGARTQGGEKTGNLSEFGRNLAIADSLIRTPESERALPYLDRLAELAGKNDSLLQIATDRRAFYLYVQGAYDSSAEELLEATRIALRRGDSTAYVEMRNNLAVILAKIEAYARATRINRELIGLNRSRGDTVGSVISMANLASNLIELERYGEALPLLEQAERQARREAYRGILPAILKFEARAQLALEQYEAVVRTVNEIMGEYADEIAPQQLDDALYYRARAYRALGRTLDAEADARGSINSMTFYKRDYTLVERLEFLSDLLAETGALQEAFELQQRSFDLRDSLAADEREMRMLEITERYENEKKERENSELRAATARQELRLARQRNYLLVGSLLALSTIVILIYWQLRRIREKNRQLRAAAERRERLERELVEGRDTIARDFHDDLGNRLASITTVADRLLRERPPTHLERGLHRIGSDARMLYSGTRDFIFSLRSDSDRVDALFTYLADFGHRLFEPYGMDFSVKSDIRDDTPLPNYWSRQIILIFKEAFTNAAKHSGADSVHFTLSWANRELCATCVDDGKGFDTDRISRTNGLANLHRRAGRIGCSLKIASDPGGTRIELSGSAGEATFSL